MSIGEELALEWAWWAWNHPRVHQALLQGLVGHAVPLIDRALRANREQGRAPGSWKQLAHPECLRRNERNVRRAKAGDMRFTYPVLLGFAAALGIPVGSLLPSNVEWITAAARCLCGGPLTPAEALAYAQHRTCRVGRADTLVLSAARKLAPVLEAIDCDLRRMEGR
jgi:hypothetical protein